MSDMPWVRFYPSNWLGGTRGMSASETGIFITLIMEMYDREEPILEDHARLARLCGATKSSFKKTLDILVFEGKIIQTETGLWNKKVAKECGFRAEKTKAAKKSANARWGKKPNKNNGSEYADAKQAHSEGNASALATQKLELERKKRDTNVSPKNSPRLELEKVLSPEHSKAVIEHRIKLRKPLTERAAKLLADKFARCPDPNAAADEMISQGWQGFKPEWITSQTSIPSNRSSNPAHALADEMRAAQNSSDEKLTPKQIGFEYE